MSLHGTILKAVTINGRAIPFYILLVDALSFNGIFRKGLQCGTEALISPLPLMLLRSDALKKLIPLLISVAWSFLCRAKW